MFKKIKQYSVESRNLAESSRRGKLACRTKRLNYRTAEVAIMKKCPICEKGNLKKVMERHFLFGVDLGMYPGEKCTACGEVFSDAEVMRKVEATAKAKGIWGLGRKTRIARTGNSLAVRIPKEVADYLRIKEGAEAYIHPEENKIVIDV